MVFSRCVARMPEDIEQSPFERYLAALWLPFRHAPFTSAILHTFLPAISVYSHQPFVSIANKIWRPSPSIISVIRSKVGFHLVIHFCLGSPCSASESTVLPQQNLWFTIPDHIIHIHLLTPRFHLHCDYHETHSIKDSVTLVRVGFEHVSSVVFRNADGDEASTNGYKLYDPV